MDPPAIEGLSNKEQRKLLKDARRELRRIENRIAGIEKEKAALDLFIALHKIIGETGRDITGNAKAHALLAKLEQIGAAKKTGQGQVKLTEWGEHLLAQVKGPGWELPPLEL